MEAELSDAARQALEALLAITVAEYWLSDDLQLFRGLVVDWRQPLLAVFEWCMDALLASERSEGVSEEFADVVAADVIPRVQAMNQKDGWRSAEVLYLRALILILDDFCAIWATLGRSCETSPVPTLRGAMLESLRQDYRHNLAAIDHALKAAHDGADDLAKQWHTWATQPHPLLEYTQRIGT